MQNKYFSPDEQIFVSLASLCFSKLATKVSILTAYNTAYGCILISWHKKFVEKHILFCPSFLSETLTVNRTVGDHLSPLRRHAPAYKHPDIYLQLCMWDDYHTFLFASLVTNRLPLDEIYHLTELRFDSLLIDYRMLI